MTETVVILNTKNIGIRQAGRDDAKKVLSLYQSAKGKAFCVWNDSYPTMEEIAHDLKTGGLYVMTHGGNIIGAISVVPENELGGFDCRDCKEGKELAGVVISEAYQGNGFAFEMVEFVEAILRKSVCKSIRLSVAKANLPAYKTYIKSGFVTVREAELYGNSYYLMEKLLCLEEKR